MKNSFIIKVIMLVFFILTNINLKSQSYSDMISNHFYYNEMDKEHAIYLKIALDSLKIDEQKHEKLMIFYRVFIVLGWSEIFYEAYSINGSLDTTFVLIRYKKNVDSEIINKKSDSVDAKKYSAVYNINVNKKYLGFYNSDIFMNFQKNNYKIYFINNTTTKYFTLNYIYKLSELKKNSKRNLWSRKMEFISIKDESSNKEVMKISKQIRKKYNKKLRNFQKNFKPLIFY
jgi:hypothetical protein